MNPVRFGTPAAGEHSEPCLIEIVAVDELGVGVFCRSLDCRAAAVLAMDRAAGVLRGERGVETRERE